MMPLLSLQVLPKLLTISDLFTIYLTAQLSTKTETPQKGVFNTLAHDNNEPSLDDVLYFGLCMLLPHDILIRFRIEKVGIVADVQQAFLQIEIDENHRDFLRFI